MDRARIILGVGLIGAAAALVPFGLIALSRSQPSPQARVAIVQDMLRQPKFRAQRENAMFEDGRAMRPLIPGVEAREDLMVPNEALNDPLHPRMIDERTAGYVPTDAAAYERLVYGTEKQADGKAGFVTVLPVPASLDLLKRGQERFNIYCAPCHGRSGYGDGMVARRAKEMQDAGADTAAGWTAPTNYHSAALREKPVGYLFYVASNGVRSMPGYAKQVSVLDRWAIVAYVKALQRSQDAKLEDVPENQRGDYR